MFSLAGPVDVTNRYAAVVLVLTRLQGDKEGVCSGVLISRHLVLTAGHCVCEQGTAGKGARDMAEAVCVKSVAVETTLYQPGSDGDGEQAPARMRRYRGLVRPHPGLRLRFNAQGQVVSSEADLALIQLSEAAQETLQPMALADKDIEVNEPLIIVGSGYDEVAHLYDGKRRASRNKAVEVLPAGGGMMRIEPPGGHHYRQDSGGPCVREQDSGAVLVGISLRDLSEGAAILSTYGYRDWLRVEIQRAETPRSPMLPQ